MMKTQIESFIDSICKNKKIHKYDESAIKQGVVLRLLSILEWDIFNVDEICPDFPVDSKMVSYSLQINSKKKVFCEVKSAAETLEHHQKELIKLASQEQIDFCVLTNGLVWWFYLISAKGDWQQKKICTIDFFKQEPGEISSLLIDLLNKKALANGQALKTAKALYHKNIERIVDDFIPQAYNQIISQPHKIFVELLTENTEKLCGHKVGSRQINEFLKRNIEKLTIRKEFEPVENNTVESDNEEIVEDLTDKYDKLVREFENLKSRQFHERKAIISFKFEGRDYKVNHWEEMLTKLCDHFAATFDEDFDRVLWLSEQGRSYFSRYEDHLEIPEKIKNTDIYVETKLSPDEILKTAKLLLSEFGYPEEGLIVNAA